ncbi:MAG: Long-chain-fatty-acid--CoA ligase [Ktedonobacterales bacterium]|jgi:long-chain acyl-CoA synthetase|nr:MAG: Long-chain-fatty-acid--CoA ligase [Ktedonobacterales bacterium]
MADLSQNSPMPDPMTRPSTFTSMERPWLAHYSSGVPASIDVPNHDLTWLLDEACRRYGANVAIEYFGRRITYLQLASLVDRFAHALLRLGLQRGDRVSLCLPNVPQFPIAFYGILKAGGVVVPTNPLYTQPEMEHQLRDAGVRMVVILDQFYSTLAAIRANTGVKQVILTSPADYLPPALGTLFRLKEATESRGKPRVVNKTQRTDSTLHRFKELLGHAHSRQGFELLPMPERTSANDLAVLQYTGGTTGLAKGAMLTHSNLLANAMQAWAWNEQPDGSRHTTLCVAPFFHVYGLTVGMNMTMLNGSTMLLLPRFTVKDTLKAIEKHQPDLFPGVPTMYLALAREAEKRRRDLSSIKVCISGSAPLPLEVQKRFEQVSGARVVEGYGLTEASPVTHCNPVYGERRIGTIGLPMSSTDAAIINPETWEFLAPGEHGEIVIRGPQVMRGYWQRPDESVNVLRDGWLRTGDLGYMSDDGYFTIEDRAKDLIIAGGLKIFPREVDEVLYQHPKVLEAAAVGVPDEYRGETVRAFVVVKPGEKLAADELRAFLAERLAPYKVPKQFEFRDSLPKTLVGKVLRRTLRDEYLARQRMQNPGATNDEA